jgi:starch phosphorylase
MRTVRPFTVVPRLPPRIERLRDLAYNVWWSWNPDATELFARLDPDLWRRSRHNPVVLLAETAQARLEEASRDEAFLGALDAVVQTYDRYLSDKGWFGRAFPDSALKVAYFSAEFGLAECVAIYSGGLGVLSGEHLKSASDLGIPLVGVGMAYGEGYHRQYLNESGWQYEFYPPNDFAAIPARGVTLPDGQRLRVSVELPGRAVHAQVWRVQVGRVPLYLLDTNTDGNTPDDRRITAQLYGGDHDMRIRQEVVLGIGGLRVLAALGLAPDVYHMNEGHSAFLALERARQAMEAHGLSWQEALDATAAANVFTTHTPVPAGNDEFPPDAVEDYFKDFCARAGIPRERLVSLGQLDPEDPKGGFSMTALALRTSERSNGVSALHGEVSRAMWTALYPDLPEHEVPIGAITNGVHAPTWIAPELQHLYARALGRRWREGASDPALWERVGELPDAELWRTHEAMRERMITFVRERLRAQEKRRGAPTAETDRAGEALDPDALTVGFARRFATYKRAALLLRDRARLERLVSDRERPVQFIFAGKAHPKDEPGKKVIQELFEATRDPALRGRLVFVEDYDMEVARAMVSGVDVWLNNPRRPLEASGTSGMKAAMNGVLNLSVLDGWWCEAWSPELGWAIGRDEHYDDPDYQDTVEATAIYDILEKDVVPRFYDRARAKAPHRWTAMMKRSVAVVGARFNTHRMVEDYTHRCYLPASARARCLLEDRAALGRALSEWRGRVRRAWPEVAVRAVRERSGTE